MALEDDIMTAVKAYVDKRFKDVTSFVGKVQSAEPLQIIMDGTSIAIPCRAFVGVTLTAEQRVVVNRYGNEYVVMGVLA